MKRSVFVLLLAVCVGLSGCANLFDGSYVSIKPHEQRGDSSSSQTVAVSNFAQLYSALTELFEAGSETCIISVANYDQSKVESDMERAVSNALSKNPIAAYAVENVEYELGKSVGLPALAVNIRYRHNRTEILKIKQVSGMDQAVDAISVALKQCETGIVLEISDYEDTDFVQVVENYALENPQYVMEQPQVTVGVYPESGVNRVVELRFGYQTSRDSLKSMQEQVWPVFTSAVLYVSGDADAQQKYSQLYSFLMERYDYQFDTSLTPTYSLLRHGVGDSRAFAVVYAAMCRQAGLECLVVSGTKNGESRYWNIVCDNGIYYHVDLLGGAYQELTDEQMRGYVWDYSAYPACGVEPKSVPEE